MKYLLIGAVLGTLKAFEPSTPTWAILALLLLAFLVFDRPKTPQEIAEKEWNKEFNKVNGFDPRDTPPAFISRKSS